MKLIICKTESVINLLYGILISFVVILIAILSFVPPVSRDALIHHLAIPKLYLQHRGIYQIPDLEFSYYPMNLDLLYIIPLYFNNDIIPKLMHFAFALITTFMIYRYLVRRLGLRYALLGSLFFLSTPVIFRLSSTAYVDLGLICFLFLSLLFLFRWTESGFKKKYLLISALFCGLALGTKYNALIGFFLISIFVPILYIRHRSEEKINTSKLIGNFALFIVTALIIFSPWMIRNTAWTGNPVYPLYDILFSNKTPIESVSNENSPAITHISHFERRRDLYGESGWEIALIPIRVFFQGKDNDPKYFDGKMNPFLLLLPIFAFIGIKKEKQILILEKTLFLLFAFLYLLFAYAQTIIRIRYIAPIIPPLVILSMFGLFNIEKILLNLNRFFSPNIKKNIIFSIVFVMLSLNAMYMIYRFNYVQPIAYIKGDVTRDAYIQKFRPEYAAFQYANHHLSRDSEILGIYIGKRSYYSDIPILFSLDILQNLASEAETAQEVYDGLIKKEVSHLLINYELFNYWLKNYTNHGKNVLKDFFEHYTVQEFFKDGYGLLKLNHK